VFALSTNGDFPAFFSKLHSRFRTPHVSILCFATFVWLLAVTGTFRWALALSAGSMMIVYGTVCATLIRFRRLHPGVKSFRVPFGSTLSAMGVSLSLILLTRLEFRQVALMGITGAVAAGNWWWAQHLATNTARKVPTSSLRG